MAKSEIETDFDVADVINKVKTYKHSSKEKAKQWLIDHMSEKNKDGTPIKPGENKSIYKDIVIDKFGAMSVRDFNKIWAEAIDETGNLLWSMPGRK